MSGIMMQLLGSGAAGASLGWYFVYDPHSYDVDEEVCFNDVVIASDDTIICAGNQNNTKTFLMSFNTDGAVQNTRQFSNSTYPHRQECGPSLDINSSDKVSLSFSFDASSNNRRWGCTVLNKDLTTAMSTSNRMTYAGDRNATGDGDNRFVRTAMGDDNRMYWTTSFTDNSKARYRITQNKTNSTAGFMALQAAGDSAPAMVTIANDKVAVCYAPDENNSGSSRLGVINADYSSTAGNDENMVWKASMDFGSGHSNSLKLCDIAWDGTYIYAIAHRGTFSASSDSGRSIGIVKTNASGTLQWQKKYRLNSLVDLNGNQGYINGLSCALDANSNLFFVGEGNSAQAANTSHLVFGKILANGDFSWCHELKWDSANSVQSGQTFTRAGNFNNGKQKSGIACGSTGAVYIATSAREIISGTLKKERPFLIKVNNDGTSIGDFGDFVISEANSATNVTSGLSYNTQSAGSGDRFAYHFPASSASGSFSHATNSTTTSIGSTDYQLNKM